ncbi:MAG: mevalonate kinase [Acidobacteriota bacterium]
MPLFLGVIRPLQTHSVKMIETAVYARAGLLGNPSDGYFGKTISTTLRNFSARITIREAVQLEVVLNRQDRCCFDRVQDLVEDIDRHGLYGGLRLLKAAIKVFAQYCQGHGLALPGRNFSLRYETDVPRQVGLGGSSAITIAALRALTQFYEVDLPAEVLPNLALDVETAEIGIAAGLQDRVCQAYGGLLYMDFNQDHMEQRGHGVYERLDSTLLPPLYLAYGTDFGQVSGLYHGSLRERYEKGEPRVLDAIKGLAQLAEEGRQCLLAGDLQELARLFDRNFDIRAQLVPLEPGHVEMVKRARRLGVCAKYAGSGGAIVGICEDEEVFSRLGEEFARVGCRVIRPRIS